MGRRLRELTERIDRPDRQFRVAMYSHDTMGLGHTRRNLLIANTLARPPLNAAVLMVTGACESIAFSMPQGVDCLTLPALHKALDGRYLSRRIDLSMKDLISLRAKTIQAALQAYEPDIFIVDKVPRGALNELDRTLEFLRTRGKTRCILGLRDVLDDRETAIREWNDARNDEAVRRYYDAVWVYGDNTVYDLAAEYGLAGDVRAKVRYTGYLDQRQWLEFATKVSEKAVAELSLPDGPLVLCGVGGGQDGGRIAEAFAQAEFPTDTTGVMLTGPFMPAETRARLHRQGKDRRCLRVVDFLPESVTLVARADRVVSMGGYNSVGEILSFEKRALVVPRVRPRLEQMVRAQRLKDLGVLDILHPDSVTPEALSEWLERDVPQPRVRERIDMNGLSRLPGLLGEFLPPGAQGDQAPGAGELIGHAH